MLAFVLLSAGLVYVALNTVWPNPFWIATLAHFAVGLTLIALTSRARVAQVMRLAGWIVVAVGTLVVIFAALPDDLAWLRDYHFGGRYQGQHWWESAANWPSAWIELSLLVQVLLIVTIFVFAVIRTNRYFLKREMSGPEGRSARTAA